MNILQEVLAGKLEQRASAFSATPSTQPSTRSDAQPDTATLPAAAEHPPSRKCHPPGSTPENARLITGDVIDTTDETDPNKITATPAACIACGCPGFWINAYGAANCLQCSPPPPFPGIVRRVVQVVNVWPENFTAEMCAVFAAGNPGSPPPAMAWEEIILLRSTGWGIKPATKLRVARPDDGRPIDTGGF